MTSRLLTLIRHASAGLERGPQGDFGRRLDARGELEAHEMRRRLLSRAVRAERLISSEALRALQTSEILAAGLGLEAGCVEPRRALYGAGTGALLAEIRAWPAEVGHVALVGHNPGLSDLVGWLVGEPVTSLPTCAVVRLELLVPAWSDADRGCALQLAFDWPRGEL